MSESGRHSTEQNAIDRIKKHALEINAIELSESLQKGDRNALAQAITLLESTNANHHKTAAQIIHDCLPAAGKSIRIGITGVPGVGKSTFIDAFGSHLISCGKKVAVLAIDPSSQVSKGSILGDKTRMDRLAANDKAFIRPSPSSQTLGGVARKTRETILLCEAAGYDVILVETVGVGQSETAVHGITDFFLLLMLSGAGDQLQGIKRGIMEMCDAMLITKADGDNVKNANFAKSEYFSALHLFPPKETGWTPHVEVVSALENKGINAVWNIILEFEKWMKDRQLFETHRQQQDVYWMHESIREKVLETFYQSSEKQSIIREAEQLLKAGKITAFEAAAMVI